MTKAVLSSLGLFLLINNFAFAQTPVGGVQIAEEEAVRRQEAVRLLRMKLDDGMALQRAGRFVESSKAYEEALGLFSRVATKR